MIRLTQQSDKNSAEEYDRIFFERAKKGVHWADKRRWRQLLKKYDGGEVLDIGALDSDVPNLMDTSLYTGIDLAQRAMEEMKERYPQGTFLVRDLYDTKFSNEEFSYVLLAEVLEHLEFPDRAVREAFRVLRVGGILAISTPLLEENEPGALDAERHIWSFDTIDIARMIEEAGGTVIDYKILRSKWFPIYKYSWPTIVCWATKK